jgi:hypothetical protein
MSSPPHTLPRKGPHMSSGYLYYNTYCFSLFIYEFRHGSGFQRGIMDASKKLILMFTQFNQLIGGFIQEKAMGNFQCYRYVTS